MSTIKSSTEHLTLNADGAGKDIKFQANGVEVSSISSAGAFTSTSIDATKLSGTVPNFTSTGIDDNATSNAITIDANENVTFGGDIETTAGDLRVRGGYFSNAVAAEALTYGSTTLGGVFAGQGSTSDFTVQNKNGQNVLTVPTGTTNVLIATTNPYLSDSYSLGLNAGAGQAFTNKATGSASGSVYQYYAYAGSSIGGVVQNGTTGVSYNTSSDYRLKENVLPMVGSIDRLKELKPSRFNFKSDTTRTVDGFLAHEAQSVVPECASGTKDAMMDEEYEVTPAVMDGETIVTEAVMGTRSVPDYQGIDQSKLVPLLVASLQEAVARIETLEARVTALEL